MLVQNFHTSSNSGGCHPFGPPPAQNRTFNIQASFCLWIASQVTFRFFYGIEERLENLAIWPWIYEVQCYNESEPKTIAVAVVIGIIFYLLMIAVIFCLSRIK